MAEIGQQELKTDYPVVEGLEADQKHHDQKNALEYQEGTTVLEREKVLL